MSANIHPTALVCAPDQIDPSVSIGPYAMIDDRVSIGKRTRIGPRVHVYPLTRIGEDCDLHDACVAGHAPQDLKYAQEPTSLTIGDRTVIREFATLHRGTKEGEGETRIGNDCLIMAYAHVAHDCRIGNHVILANAVQLAGHVTIDDYAAIGGMVPVHQFVRIGRHAFIGGGFRVTQDVPPFVLAAGNPLKYAGLNYTGLKRRGFSPEALRTIEKIYFVLYQSRLTMQAALTRIHESFEMNGVAEEIVRFFEQSERGVIRR